MKIKLTKEQQQFFEIRKLKALLQSIIDHLGRTGVVLPQEITTQVNKQL